MEHEGGRRGGGYTHLITLDQESGSGVYGVARSPATFGVTVPVSERSFCLDLQKGPFRLKPAVFLCPAVVAAYRVRKCGGLHINADFLARNDDARKCKHDVCRGPQFLVNECEIRIVHQDVRERQR